MSAVLPRKHWGRLPQRGSGQMWRCGAGTRPDPIVFWIKSEKFLHRNNRDWRRGMGFSLTLSMSLPPSWSYFRKEEVGVLLALTDHCYSWNSFKSAISVTNYKVNAFSMNPSSWSRQFRLKRPRIFRKAELHHRGR